jgi:hypothetical protein
MGYDEKRARKAVKATWGGEGIVDAVDWLEAKKVEAEIDVSFCTLDLSLGRLKAMGKCFCKFCGF